MILPNPLLLRIFRLVSWNAEHPKHRLDEVISAARNFEADILGITETESTSPADAARWAKAFPDHSVQTLPGFMLFITRGKILSATTRSLNDRGRANVIELELQARRLRIVFVEFDANPFRSRAPAFAALEACMEVADGAELLVFGDFNTPLQSHFFAPLRQRWHHAFEQAGRGWSETWPMPSPVLSLDHVWYSRGLTALRCEHGWSTLSDHRPVIADFAWPRQSESPLPPD